MDRKSMEKKMRIFTVLVIGAFLVLIVRLAFLQLIEAEEYQTKARLNHQRLITITAPRGEIVDRNGIRVVGNKPVYTISVAYLGLKDTSKVVGRLAQLLVGEDIYEGWSAGRIKEDIDKKMQAQSLKLYEPVKVSVGVSYEAITRLEENRLDLPGVFIDIQPIRDYPLKDLLAQTVGFVREIDQRQLEKNKDNGYEPGDNFGQTGLESQYEYFLRGQDGGRVVEVDALGRPVRYLGVKSPVAGNKLVLTIDSRLQRVAQDALAQGAQMAKDLGYAKVPAGKSVTGAAVALDVQTGEVLAMASFPSYDPTIFTRTLSAEDYNEVSSQGALKNHAVEDVYIPGSTFKMVTSAALLEGKIITPLTKIFCTGFYKYKKDWKVHGEVDLRKALMYSCDVFFYHFGAIMGPDLMVKYAKEFGLGEKTGIDLPGEENGQIASPERKKEVWKSNAWESQWHEYDSMDMAIGQQDNKFTALQLANYIAMIANGGKAMQPYLVQKIVSPDGKVVQQFSPNMIREVNVSHETLEVIREGMHMVTLPPSGTASGVFAGASYQTAAKTGTAEVGDKAGNTNALFVAFAPFDKPKIAVSVVLGYGGKGSGISGPVARQILDEFFKEQK
ncbi:MAG: Cell division protein [Desulfotomaculum sp. 46_296]|nr:MAG: Cell division protein [Desulfotomaculum sp. 46_296]HAU32356.1 penicillin-binding protein 2 [Desulfotomaculum sp.]